MNTEQTSTTALDTQDNIDSNDSMQNKEEDEEEEAIIETETTFTKLQQMQNNPAVAVGSGRRKTFGNGSNKEGHKKDNVYHNDDASNYNEHDNPDVTKEDDTASLSLSLSLSLSSPVTSPASSQKSITLDDEDMDDINPINTVIEEEDDDDNGNDDNNDMNDNILEGDDEDGDMKQNTKEEEDENVNDDNKDFNVEEEYDHDNDNTEDKTVEEEKVEEDDSDKGYIKENGDDMSDTNMAEKQANFENDDDNLIRDEKHGQSNPPLKNTLSTIEKKSKKISNDQVLQTTDEIYHSDKIDLNVTGINQLISMVEKMLNVSLSKKKRKMVKARIKELIALGTQHDKDVDEVDEDDHIEDEEIGDIDDSDDDGKDDEDYDAASLSPSTQEQASNDSRSRRNKNKQRRRIQPELESRRELNRKERMAQEELQALAESKLSEADQKRAEAIAARFETTTDEAIEQRMEDRGLLLNKLLNAKMEVLQVDQIDKHGSSSKNDDVAIVINTNNDASEYALSDEEDEMELEIIGGYDGNQPKSSTTTVAIAEEDNSKMNELPSPPIFVSNRSPLARNRRAALKQILRQKSIENSNTWLARYVKIFIKIVEGSSIISNSIFYVISL